MTRSASRTVGVEEELLLVTAADGRPVALGEAVVRAESGSVDPELELTQIDHEFKQEQAETASNPATHLHDLRDELVELRSRLAAAARSRGGLAVASATSPLKDPSAHHSQ
jgi:carboxylate-amine ligase